MAAAVTSRDVQEIVSKLSSDKAKTREEGLKLLNTWLDGQRSTAFSSYLSRNSAMLKPNEITHSETWPFLVHLLIQCVREVPTRATKRSSPRLPFAKTLRVLLQRAEDSKLPGCALPLLPVVKLLFNHIWDILSNDPTLQSEYGLILRHLLLVRDYRFHMKRRIYSSLVLWYIEKVETSLHEKISNPMAKEEVFRSILTLQSLLENPPGDFPENLRERIIQGFVNFFAAEKDEGKISRKLVECCNIYLLQDGPNLGSLPRKVHESLKHSVFRIWLKTSDRSLNDALTTYARLQLHLERNISSESFLLDKLVDNVCKELDQISMSSSANPRNDVKDDNLGYLSDSNYNLVELAALVFYKSCLYTMKAPAVGKRARTEHAAVRMNEALTKGEWLWMATFCFLTRKYYNHLSKEYFISWFEGICSNFGRIINDAIVEHLYDGLLWTLRSLGELSFIMKLTDSAKEVSLGWQSIWNTLMHGLPAVCNIMAVVDGALMLLGNLIARDLVNTCIVPEDVWDLRLFNELPSLSVLYFISCYFSRRESQGNLRDILHRRKNLLQAVLGHPRWQESSVYNEKIVLLLPAAVYALCAGRAPFECNLKEISSSYFFGAAEALNGRFKRDDDSKNFDCSAEALARIISFPDEVCAVRFGPGVRLPRQLRDPLQRDMETHIQGALLQDEIKSRPLQEIMFSCALYANLIYGSILTRQNEDASSVLSKMVHILLELLDYATAIIGESQNHFHSHGCLGPASFSDGTSSIISSFRIFVSSPIFTELRDTRAMDAISHHVIKQSIERLLRAIVGLYKGNMCKRSPQLNMELSSAEIPMLASFIPDDRSRFADIELDVDTDFKDLDIYTVGGKVTAGLTFSMENWKLAMISLVSCFLVVLQETTWDILFDLLKNEENTKVRENILQYICQHSCWSSIEHISEMVLMIDDMLKEQIDRRLDCRYIIVAIHSFIGALLSVNKYAAKEKQYILPSKEKDIDKNYALLGELVVKVAVVDLLDWVGRVELVNSICHFILLCPGVGLMLTERLFPMLRDSDYRVRVIVARRIGVLFETWDGHVEMFQDICSNFGFPLVCCLKGNVTVSAKEVLAAAQQPHQIIETVLATLMHVAIKSDIIEMEALFMICVISAIDPCHREMVSLLLDSISKELQYTCKSKYLEEVLGSIIFNWVICGVSLVALLEIRQYFVYKAEPGFFMQHCCQWLLPALILHDQNHKELRWLAQLLGQPLKMLVRDHFVPIFAVCIALHSSKIVGSEKGGEALQSSILQFAEISELERDNLIKKHMVSIVSHVLSFASDASEPTIPFFPKVTITRAIQTVVDGFLDMGESRRGAGIIDKINIFRPDRVFMFIVEIHHRITAAVHSRHKIHRLAEVEVLIDILGHRIAVSSTLNYLLNLTGQHIDCLALQDQCYRIISSLLDNVENNTSKEIICVLGEQLQFLVSKLLESCCLSSPNGEILPGSTRALSVLHQLILQSDPSLHDHIRELEPFPAIDMFGEIHKFHEDLSLDYSLREHLLNFVKRSCYLPPRLLFWSFQALHRKFQAAESFQREWESGGHEDYEIVAAVWTLVRICASDDADGVRLLVSDFLSRVGIGDPHCVVFHLPGRSSGIHVFDNVNSGGSTEVNFTLHTGIPDEVLIALLKLLKKYLMDDSVEIVDMTSQVLRGILSTERGQSALLSIGPYERSLIEIHSSGVNTAVVEKFLLELEQKFKAEAMPLEESSTWETHGKTFEMWLCPLVFSIVGHCSDVILRLCQDIVMLKADVSELLLPSIMVDIARRKDLNPILHQLISTQVQKHIFVETNTLIKSIQVFLNSLNELRICYVMERFTSVPSNLESSQLAKPSSYGSRSRPSAKKLDHHPSFLSAVSSSSWQKVYWLYIDYLVAAKSALVCGWYFTSVLYVEYWCEEHFGNLTLGNPDFSPQEELSPHIEVLLSAVTRINEPDSLYGIIQAHKLTSQIVTFEHESNWSKALEYYDLQVRSEAMIPLDNGPRSFMAGCSETQSISSSSNDTVMLGKPYKGLIRSLQQIGCAHVLDLYCQGLSSRKGQFQYDQEFAELQYEAAWRAGNWDFSLLTESSTSSSCELIRADNFNESLHSCLRALREGSLDEFQGKLKDSKQKLVLAVSHASEESTESIYSTIIKLQILYHLGTAWNLRWTNMSSKMSKGNLEVLSEPVIPTIEQMTSLNSDWESILRRTQLHMNLLEPFLAFRRILLNILGCKDCLIHHLLLSASTLRKGSRFSLAAAALHELKFLAAGDGEHSSASYWLGRLEEAKLLRAQGQKEMAISLAKYMSQNSELSEMASDVYCLAGKWLAETRSSNSKTILESYLKPAVALAEKQRGTDKRDIERQNQTHFRLAHYADALFKSYEVRLTSNEWQAAMRLRKHKTLELEALIRRLKSSSKDEKTDYSVKIQELQKQLSMDKEEAERLQDDRDNFLDLALEGYKRCLVTGDKYDVRAVFRLVTLWFSLSTRQNVINNMLGTIEEVQSYKFVPLVYQIASRMGSSKEGPRKNNFQFALVSLLKKMAMDHPYHTIFQLLALANGDRIKDKQRSRSSFVVDMDKKLAAENLLNELSAYHGDIICQMKQMVEVYIKLAELETRREEKKMSLPRDIRSVRQLELVPVVTASIPVDRSCQYRQGTFPHFDRLGDSITIMNGINAPKVVECIGSDGKRYRQLAKSGNDDLRQDAVMEQFFGLVNTFLQNRQDTRRRRLGVRTYKVVPFTPSAGVVEWVNGTVPLGDYLIGSMRNGGAHRRYGHGDWPFMKCREHMNNAKDKRKAFQEVCEKFRPVMHHFFLERFLLPSEWFEKRLAYTRSVATSSMVDYIVGLGDRHAMNILIDQATAEVVHIDLGVAFEQGLMLKTPERVPFRLTRDIIDGMGVTGVEGVFRRCCEETLSVMRTNKEALLTIIEVFIHDPLYKWALSPLKALQRQKETDDDLEMCFEGSLDESEGNKDAARALMRVKQKLDGYESGEMRSLNGQVQQLIQDAIDPERLCQMFPGWGAWL